MRAGPARRAARASGRRFRPRRPGLSRGVAANRELWVCMRFAGVFGGGRLEVGRVVGKGETKTSVSYRPLRCFYVCV